MMKDSKQLIELEDQLLQIELCLENDQTHQNSEIVQADSSYSAQFLSLHLDLGIWEYISCATLSDPFQHAEATSQALVQHIRPVVLSFASAKEALALPSLSQI